MSATHKSSMLSLLNNKQTPNLVEPARRHASRLVLLSKQSSGSYTTSTHHRGRRELYTSAVNFQQNKPASNAAANNATENEKSANFLNGSSTVYVEEIYQSWLNDPKSVHKSWDIYFRTNSVQAPPTLGQTGQAAASAAGALAAIPDLNQIVKLLQQQIASPSGPSRYSTPSLVPSSPEDKLVEDHLKLYALIRSYQIRGHKKANLDPLGIGRYLFCFTINSSVLNKIYV